MARRSATEAAAQVHVALKLGLADEVAGGRARELLHRVVSMLVRMVAVVERRE